MKKSFFLFTLMLPFLAFGQTNYLSPLISKIKNADSIKVISHKITEEYSTIEDTLIGKPNSNSQVDVAYPLLVNNKLNPKVVIESHTLSKVEKERLVEIFDRIVILTKVMANCDQPQHSIFIYKKGVESYIDICFGCRRIHTSKDIHFSESNMDIKRWDDFLQFFKSMGLTQLFNN